MKVAIYQTDPVLLDLKANLEEIVTKINHGRELGVHLNVFPELALTGYFVGARYHKVARRLDSQEIRELASATKGTAAVVGFIEESPSMNFYDSALVAVDGEILFAYRKLNLPSYGVFEEGKIFAPGKQVPVFRLQGFTIATFICNDLWHPAIPYLAVCRKADIFVSIINSTEDAMGDEFSNIETWGIINTFYSRIFGIYNICANRAGEERLRNRRIQAEVSSDKTTTVKKPDSRKRRRRRLFWGGSEIVNPYGQTIAKAALYEQDEIFAEITRDLLRKKRILLPYLRNDDPYFTHRELERILYEEKRIYET